MAATDFSGEAKAVKTATQASPAAFCTHALRRINQGKPLGFDAPSLIPADLKGRVEASGSRLWKQKLIKIICPFSGSGSSVVPLYPLTAFADLWDGGWWGCMPVSRLNWELEMSTRPPVQNGEGNMLPVCCSALCPFLGCFWGAGRVDTVCCWEWQHRELCPSWAA